MAQVTLKNYKQDKYYPRIVKAVTAELEKYIFVSPINLFKQMELVKESDIIKWRKGQIPYFEKVIICNLNKANRILRILRFHAHDCNLHPSITVYKKSGKLLRFSKTGDSNIEEAYSRHFVRGPDGFATNRPADCQSSQRVPLQEPAMVGEPAPSADRSEADGRWTATDVLGVSLELP